MTNNTNKAIKKINAHSWTLIVDSIRDQVWAKIKNGKVHVISSYYDEDGFFSREVYVGNTYKEAMGNKRVFFHWEEFEPYYFDEDE